MRTLDEQERLVLFLHYAAKSSPRLYRTLARMLPPLPETFELAARHALGSFSGLGEETRARMYEAAGDGFFERLEAWMDRRGVTVLLRDSEGYPALLSEIHDPPEALFVRGGLDADPLLPIAVIGARKSTEYGRGIARTFSRALAEQGATIVSGMASGIDAEAARGALEAGTRQLPTVAVLGSGIDVVYPKENEALYAEISERGAVVSEFWPGTRPSRENFPVRNRIMSGLSRGVVVVEAGERSGTSITAGYAHDEGREVFAVPGRLTDPQSAGTNRMIQNGEAKPVFAISDILDELTFLCGMAPKTVSASAPKEIRLSSLPQEQQAVCRVLLLGENDADSIAEQTGLSTGLLNSALTAMTFSGIMKQLPGRVYALDRLKTKLLEE